MTCVMWFRLASYGLCVTCVRLGPSGLMRDVGSSGPSSLFVTCVRLGPTGLMCDVCNVCSSGSLRLVCDVCASRPLRAYVRRV